MPIQSTGHQAADTTAQVVPRRPTNAHHHHPPASHRPSLQQGSSTSKSKSVHSSSSVTRTSVTPARTSGGSARSSGGSGRKSAMAKGRSLIQQKFVSTDGGESSLVRLVRTMKVLKKFAALRQEKEDENEEEEEEETQLKSFMRFSTVVKAKLRAGAMTRKVQMVMLERAAKKEQEVRVRGAMASLLELLKAPEEDRNVNAIATHILEVAPKLLKHLPKSAQRRVAATVTHKVYQKGEIVIREGDRPDGFYFVVFGEISIYKAPVEVALYEDVVDDEEEEALEERRQKKKEALAAASADEQVKKARVEEHRKARHKAHFEDEAERERCLGKHVISLPVHSEFGSYAFSFAGKELKRTASIVADGRHLTLEEEKERDEVLQAREFLAEARRTLRGSTAKDRDAASMAVQQATIALQEAEAQEHEWHLTECLVVPNKIYIMEMSPKADTKLQISVAVLERCLLFESFELEAMYTLARKMEMKNYDADHLVSPEGEPITTLLLVLEGELKIHVAHELDALTTLPLEVARLPKGEVFGLVEAHRRLPFRRASATAVCDGTRVASVPIDAFRRALAHHPHSAELVKKIVINRENWERLRCDCAVKYHLIARPPLTLTVEMTTDANYLAEPSSLLTGAAARKYKAAWSKIQDLRRSSESAMQDVVMLNKSSIGDNAAHFAVSVRKALTRAESTTSLALQIAAKLRVDFCQSARLADVAEELQLRRDRVREKLYHIDHVPERQRSTIIAVRQQAEAEPATPQRRRGSTIIMANGEPRPSAVEKKDIEGARTRFRRSSVLLHQDAGDTTVVKRWMAQSSKAGLAHPVRFSLSRSYAEYEHCDYRSLEHDEATQMHQAARGLELALRESDVNGEWQRRNVSLAKEALRRKKPVEKSSEREDTLRHLGLPHANGPHDTVSYKQEPEPADDDESVSSTSSVGIPAMGGACALAVSAMDVAAMPAALICSVSPAARKFFRGVFEQGGCVVDEESRGTIALERMQRRNYALVVLGFRLAKGLRGMTVARRHRDWEAASRDKSRPPTPICVLLDKNVKMCTSEAQLEKLALEAHGLEVDLEEAGCSVGDLLRHMPWATIRHVQNHHNKTMLLNTNTLRYRTSVSRTSKPTPIPESTSPANSPRHTTRAMPVHQPTSPPASSQHHHHHHQRHSQTTTTAEPSAAASAALADVKDDLQNVEQPGHIRTNIIPILRHGNNTRKSAEEFFKGEELKEEDKEGGEEDTDAEEDKQPGFKSNK